MITQYTRLIVKKSDNSIDAATSQDFPFADGWEPVSYDPATHEAYDFVMETDYVNQDHGIGRTQEVLRGRKILDNFEIVAGQPGIKTAADSEVAAKVLTISARKDITETETKAELIADILAIIAPQTEAEFLDELRLVSRGIPRTLAEFSTLQLIRLKTALEA